MTTIVGMTNRLNTYESRLVKDNSILTSMSFHWCGGVKLDTGQWSLKWQEVIIPVIYYTVDDLMIFGV